MSRRRCCCGTGTGTGTAGCVVFSDSFTRPDSTDVGSDWLEYGGPGTGTSGPFRIANNKLAITGGNGETLECLHTVPSDVGTGTANPDHYLVYVSVGFDTDRDRAIVKVDDEAVYVELERYTSTRGQIRIFENDVCKGSRNVPLYPSNTIVVCVDGTMVHVSLGAAELLSIPHTTVSGIVHLSAYTTGTVTFDDFVLSEHYYDDPACPDCRSEDCEWFFDSGFDSGELSDTDYVHAVGTGTGTAEGGWDYYNGNIRCTQDARLQIAVTAPRGDTGAVEFSLSWSVDSNVGLSMFFSYDGSDTGVEIARESDGVYARWYVAGEQVGEAVVVPRAYVFLCWDGEELVGETGGISYSLGTSITSFSPAVEVSGLTSGYALITQISATKTGSLLGPPRACPECGAQDCGCNPFYSTALLTLRGLSTRDPWPKDDVEMPYDMECPGTVSIHLTATNQPSVLGEGCHWRGQSDAVIPYYGGVFGGWTLVPVRADMVIEKISGGLRFIVSLTVYLDDGGLEATVYMSFSEDVLGDDVRCDSLADVACTDCRQSDFMYIYQIYYNFIACQFCNCVSFNGPPAETCSDFTTPLTLDFVSPDPTV